MHRSTLLALALSAALPGAGPAKPAPEATGAVVTELSSAQKRLLQEACVEVVVPKPEKDSSTYAKELPWDQVPYAIRTDKFYSIGTAFAISRTELVTAFHVLSLNQTSLSYPKYYIRDQNKNVYELDQVTLSHEHKDVVRFTVKNHSFDHWLDLNPTYELNRTVFTAGNAYGEGVVVRRGELIGTSPEEFDGTFPWLRSSSEINPGNSGGPLLDAQGRVIGVVVRRKDNIAYSLPIGEMQSIPDRTAVFQDRITYGFNLFSARSKAIPDEFSLKLPLPYGELRDQAVARRWAHYTTEMDALFAKEGPETFPKGDSSFEAIRDIPTNTVPQHYFKEETTGLWRLSGLETRKIDLGGNAKLISSSGSGLGWFRIIKAPTTPLAELEAKPRLVMDMILKGLNITRELGGQTIRITSHGEPFRRGEHRDRWGRPWQICVWHLEFSDQVVILASTPVPGGLTVVAQQPSSSKLEVWEYDLKRILDFTSVPYTGKLKDWSEFLAKPERLPEAFRSIRLAYTPGKALDLKTPWMNLALPSTAQEIGDDAILGLYMGYSFKGSEPTWDLRRVSLDEAEEDNYFVVLKHLKPGAPSPEEEHRRWREMTRQRHPYSRKPYQEDGRTNIAALLPLAPGTEAEAYTLYIGRSGSLPDGKMSKTLDKLSAAITLPPTR